MVTVPIWRITRVVLDQDGWESVTQSHGFVHVVAFASVYDGSRLVATDVDEGAKFSLGAPDGSAVVAGGGGRGLLRLPDGGPDLTAREAMLAAAEPVEADRRGLVFLAAAG